MDSRGNVDIQVNGTQLVITVETDLAKVDAAPSASGKTLTIATTGGYRWNVCDQDGLGVNLTVSKRIPRDGA